MLARRLVRFRVPLEFGEQKTIVSTGPVSLVAQCRQNVDPDGSGPSPASDRDEVRLLGATTQPGAFLQGDVPHSGPGAQTSEPTFDATTAADKRVLGGLTSISSAPDQPAADDDIDNGFVMGPDGSYIGIDETTAYTLRVGGSACSVIGVATVVAR